MEVSLYYWNPYLILICHFPNFTLIHLYILDKGMVFLSCTVLIKITLASMDKLDDDDSNNIFIILVQYHKL